MKLIMVAALSLLALPRAAAEPARKPAPDGWLRGDTDQRFAGVERQLRGLDVAMIEVGHRYLELFWAGEDRNWNYARYQVGKIRLSLANALERRPKRAVSAAAFEAPLAAVEAAVAKADPAVFAARFDDLTKACNGCHAAEAFAFAKIVKPDGRGHSPVRGP